MQPPPQTLLCRYRYDPLDQLASHALPGSPERQRFYCKSRLVTEMQGVLHYSIFQRGDQLLAEHKNEGGALDTALLVTDLQRSVLHTLKADHQSQSLAYTPYGHRPTQIGFTSLLEFNGERPDPMTGNYLLGNGYRAFNTALLRFNSPDTMSPFGKGGLNAYGYCLGDPINKQDSSGHFPKLNGFQKWLKTPRKKSTPSAQTASNQKYRTLHNRKPEMLDGELESYGAVKNIDINNEPIQLITTAEDLKNLQIDQHYKFILTQDESLIIGAPTKLIMSQNNVNNYFMSHGVLALHSSKNQIISAGYLKITEHLKITINNHSGHYKPKKRTLKPVRTLLESMGVQVTSIRTPGRNFKPT
jgi:RHS repeat-associated protein